MNELALFAGAGGGILGSVLLGHRIVCAVERDPYCREVLLRRQEDRTLPPFPVWDDVCTFNGREWRGVVDIVSAGFPCQPFSVAGQRKGEDDERNLWPETIRIIREVGPRFAFLENVPGLTTADKLILFSTAEEGQVYTLEEWEDFSSVFSVQFELPSYFGRILGDLAEAGYDAEWCVLGADDVGAPHRRKRLWILAYAKHGGPQAFVAGRGESEISRACLGGSTVAHSVGG